MRTSCGFRIVSLAPCCVGAAACLGLGVGTSWAQQPDREQRPAATQAPAPQAPEQQQATKGGPRDAQDASGGPQAEGRMNRPPGEAGRVLVAFDLDGDQVFDAYEFLFIEDLSEARQRSRDRARSGGMNPREQGIKQQGRQAPRRMDRGRVMGPRFGDRGRHPMFGQRGTRQGRMASSQGRQPRNFRMQGEIRDLKSVRLVGLDEPHRIAKLDTDRGVVRVDLGPLGSVEKLELEEGDRIMVHGSEGRLNERRMLIATQVQSGPNSVRIHREQLGKQRKIEGEVVATRHASFQGVDKPHRIVRVRTQSGEIVRADLGQQGRNDQVKVAEGDDIVVVGQCGRINGKSALIANQVRVNEGQYTSLARANAR